MKKRLVSFLSIIACLGLLFSVQVTGVTASAAEQDGVDMQVSAEDFSFYTEPWMENWLSGDFSSIAEYDSQYTANGLSITYDAEEDDYLDMIEKAGAFVEYKEAECTSTDDGMVIITRKAVCENRNVNFTFNYNMMDGSVVWSVEMDSSTGEVVAKAGLNTLMGMGTVFCVLIFIIFVISLFKLLSYSGKKKDTADDVKPEVVPQAQPAISVPEETASDDEIIAVISAAIAAYEEESQGMDVPADGLIVRSIRKRF